MKILVVKTSSLGDIIHAFPVLSYLRKQDPGGEIDWVVEERCAELLEAHPHVNRVLKMDSRKWRKGSFKELRELRKTFYDAIFDLQGNVKSSVVLMGARGKKKVGFGWKTAPEWPNALFTGCKVNPPHGLNIREDYLYIVKNYFNDRTPYEIEPIELRITEKERQQVDEVLPDATIVCPGSAWSNKQLTQDQLLALLKQMQEKYLFAWGNDEERELVLQLAAHFPDSLVLPRCSLPVLQHVMAKCRRVIAMDSLPLHLCATTKTPSLSFFGPSSAKKYGPLGTHHKTIQGLCPYGITFEKRCPKLRTCPTGACLKELRGDGV